MRVTIKEIRDYLAGRNATLERQRGYLNGQAFYKIVFDDGSWKKRTVSMLKTEYLNGAL